MEKIATIVLHVQPLDASGIWWNELIKLGSFAVLGGCVIWWLLTNRKELINQHNEVIKEKDKLITDLNVELKEYSKDYKEMANKSLSVLILVDDKLKNDATNSENIKDIHRMVSEIIEIEKRRNSK